MNKYEVTVRDANFDSPYLIEAKVYIEAETFEEACNMAKKYLKSLQNFEIIKCEYNGMCV